MTSTINSPSGVSVSIAEPKTWLEFYPKTEMIVTKRRGRVIFPHLKYRIQGLERSTLYHVHIHLERVDGIKYKFDQAEWKEAGKGDPLLPTRHMEHPDGARSGEHWMSDDVSFSHLKITNDPKNGDAKLVLVQSMHKYQPVLTILKHGDMRGEEFRLEITQFVVVTAYQSEEMIALKVAHNKFASGFRSNGKKRHSTDSDESPTSSKRSAISPFSTSSDSNSPPSSWPLNQIQNLNLSQNPLNSMQNLNQMQNLNEMQIQNQNQNPMFPTFQHPYFPMDFSGAYFGGYYGMHWNQYQWGMENTMANPTGFQNL